MVPAPEACLPWSTLNESANTASLVRALRPSAKGKLMKKVDEMRAEYRREELGKGVRGKHFAAYRQGSNLVLLKPELAKISPDADAVNAALESLVGIAKAAVSRPARKGSSVKVARRAG